MAQLLILCKVITRWHLGFCNPAYLATNRGFDTQYGFMNSQIWNYVKTNQVPPYPYDWFLNDTSIGGPEQILPFSGVSTVQ